MNIEYMETMAREYNKQLKGSVSTDGYIESSIAILERQLDIIAVNMNNGNKYCNKSLAYIDSLKRCSLKMLTEMKNEKCIPECKEKLKLNGGFNTLVNLEVDLFINLDYIKENGQNVDCIIENELRSLGFMGCIQ